MASSAPAPPTSGFYTELFLIVIIVLILARRTYAMIQGTTYSAARLFVFAGFYVVIYLVLSYGTLAGAFAYWGSSTYLLILAYVAIPVVAGLVAAPRVERVVHFEQRADGQWYYKLGWVVPVAYLVLFVTRLVAEVVILGPSAFYITFPPPPAPSLGALITLVAVDLLFGVSLGLLLGRGFGVYRAYQKLPKPAPAPPPPPSTPLPDR